MIFASIPIKQSKLCDSSLSISFSILQILNSAAIVRLRLAGLRRNQAVKSSPINTISRSSTPAAESRFCQLPRRGFGSNLSGARGLLATAVGTVKARSE
jgi:hypothetical protein